MPPENITETQGNISYSDSIETKFWEHHTLWSTNSSRIRHVPVSKTRRCLTRHRHIWLHWIMKFSQIISGADVSVFVVSDVGICAFIDHTTTEI